MNRARHLILTALALVLALTGLSGHATAHSSTSTSYTTTAAAAAAEPRPPRLLILGDSISAKSYYNPGRHGKGWWAHLAEATDSRLIMSVENGSGLVRRGLHCTGTTFGERLARLDVSRADAIVVQGGVNDVFRCSGDGRLLRAKGSYLRKRVPAFMDRLAAAADAAGIPRDHIYVFTPWGVYQSAQRKRIRTFVRAHTERIGAEYVDVPALSERLTRDGVHPTRKGNRFLYRKLTRGSTILDRVSSAG
jgi:lysophospholipase L1-like esterase